jgi:NAD(P)-dependent dehydrogenase (short-subunit alcohol dehydrogenase family)
MKVVIVGAGGTIGRAVAQNLGNRHTVITAGRSSGDHHVDFTDDACVTALFREIGPVDAIVSAAGGLYLGPLAQTSAAQFNLGLQDKLLGQVRLTLIGQHYLNEGGSITLTSGAACEEPIAQGTNAATVNNALDGFVRAAATELRGGRRINIVSPTVLTESWEAYGALFPGHESVSASRVALAYQRSVEGVLTGHVYRVV